MITLNALQIDPNNAITLSSYANALAGSDKVEQAFDYFERALQIDPNNAKTKASYAFHLGNHALALVRSGKVEQAFDYFECALKIKPDNAITLTSYANALARSDKVEQAFDYFERALQIDPNNAITLSSYANALAGSDKVEQAFDYFERALQIDPNNAITLSSYANALAGSDKVEQSLDYFERALQIDPNNAITLSSYANALAGSDKVEQAFDYFERALQIDPNNAITLSSYANALAGSDKVEQSLDYFERALQIDPNNAKTKASYAFHLGHHASALVRSGKVEQAFDYFECALKIKPDNAITLTSYANALARSDKVEQSLDYFERALQIDPNNPITLTNYARALIRAGRVERSFAYFERALKIEPNNAITLTNYADVLARADRVEESFKYFKRALEINPNDIITLTNYARALVRSYRTEEALAYFERALEIQPNDAITLSSYARALTRVGRAEQSFEYFEKALKIGPNHAITLGVYADALGRHASALTRNDNAQKASGYFEKALEIEPGNARILFRTAENLQNLGEYAKAAEKLERILQLDNPDADNFFVRYTLGCLYIQLGREDAGKDQLRTAIVESHNAEAATLRIAQVLMAVSPRHKHANQLLRDIEETSPLYAEAQQALGLNLDSSSHFELFGQNATGRLQDQAALTRALYHKINNRIAILKEILYEKLSGHEDPLLRDLVGKISDILKGIKELRARADRDSQTGKLGDLNYAATLEIIAETAHDIADFVVNKISSLSEQLWEFHNLLPFGDERIVLHEDLKKHIQRALDALNDLKRINEGIRLQFTTLSLRELFDPWLNTPALRDGRVRIQIDLGEADRSVTVDVEKVRGFLDELVENSLKHNVQKVESADLYIEIFVSVTPGLPLGRGGRMITTPVEYLNIQIKDNGKGVAADQKDWIFQPLATTAQDGEGTGLGLFDIRRTIERMHGFIRETGVHGEGACFKLYIPLETPR